ncbi:MAG: pyridoxamine 5'-phosphate oxidase family protein [Thermonemataceae bacterium]
MQLLQLAQEELTRSNADKKHPFRYFVLATLGDYPEVRTVVSRKVTQDLSVVFFTDTRSPKVAQIEDKARVSALYYHPKKKLQVRIKGTATLISASDPTYTQFLHQAQQSSLKDYTTQKAPGSILEAIDDTLTQEKVYFSPIKITPAIVEVLQLGREQHLRSAYYKQEDTWVEKKLVP